MRRSNFTLVLAAAVASFALAACSSSSKPASSSTNPPTSSAGTPTTVAATGGAETVSLGSSKFGKILVDSQGMTLYVQEKDKPGKPACTGACLTAWPPLKAPASPTYGAGLDASKYSTVTAADGTKQLAVNGFPLYLWMNDKKPGDVTGQDVGGFYVVQASGEKYDPGAKKGS